MLQAITRLLRREKRGISTVIVVMLSLVLLVIIVGNVVLWSYQMNQVDMDRMQENLTILNVTRTEPTGFSMEIKNTGSISAHVVAVWITNSTVHQRYSADFFLNAGETATYNRTDIPVPPDAFLAKLVTERGNIAVFSTD
jgi:Na+-transporting NADH:ubiquinone oxidoreductase subunit NqrC